MVLDEVQRVEGWELFVNRMPRKGVRVIAIGPDDRIQNGRLATHLTGRHMDTPLFPFSFGEFLQASPSSSKTKARFEEYLRLGGFPGLVYKTSPDEETVVREAVKRASPRKAEALWDTASLLMDRVPFIPEPALMKEKDVRKLLQARLFIEVPEFGPSEDSELYPADHSMAKSREGKIRTIVLLELLAKCAHDSWSVSRLPGCDFVVHYGRNVKLLVNVICGDCDREGKLKGLVEASAWTGRREMLLLTDDHAEDIRTDKGTVKVRPVYEWLATPFPSASDALGI